MGATSNHKMGGMGKKVKEELGPSCLEVVTIGCLIEHLEGQEWPDFEGKARTIDDFKLIS